MSQDRLGSEQRKPDSALNVWINTIRNVTTPEGADAFVQYKQGLISKARLVELIAMDLDD